MFVNISAELQRLGEIQVIFLNWRIVVSKEKCPVLTAKTCAKMENLRTAIEVLSGQHVSIVQIDFYTERGKVKIGSTVCEFSFWYMREERLLHFALVRSLGSRKHEDWEWHDAFFDRLGKVRVVSNHVTHNAENWKGAKWWVGYSDTDRHEEPLVMESFRKHAERLGCTVVDYLHTEYIDSL